MQVIFSFVRCDINRDFLIVYEYDLNIIGVAKLKHVAF